LGVADGFLVYNNSPSFKSSMVMFRAFVIFTAVYNEQERPFFIEEMVAFDTPEIWASV